MKKIIYFAIAAIAALSSCSSDDGVANETPSTTPGQAGAGKAPVFKATIEGAATSRTTLEGTSLEENAERNVLWESTDEVIINGAVYGVYNGAGTTSATLTKKSGEDPTAPYKAYFPTSLKSGSTLTLPNTYEGGKYNLPMYAESDNNTLEFKNLCGILAITVPYEQLTSVKSIIVSSDKQMNGAFSVTSPAKLTFNTGSTAVYSDKKVTLTFSTAKTIPTDGSETFYVAIPPQTYGYLHVAVKDNSGVIKSMRTKGKSTVTIARSEIYPIAFSQDTYTQFLYTVSSGANKTVHDSDDKKVCFTHSNIYWDGSNYRFEENPTNYRTSRTENHVSHFNWTSITDYNGGLKMPWSETYESSTKETTDKLFCGQDNAITVEGKSGLFVLTRAEWDHLLKGEEYESSSKDFRHDAVNLRKYGVTVAGHPNCIIIAHDDYLTLGGAALKDEYTAVEWAEMEKKGVVCLPAAGTNANNTSQDEGYYWTSTPCQADPETDAALAFYIHFTHGTNIGTGAGRTVSNTRGEGLSIRLVYLPTTP